MYFDKLNFPKIQDCDLCFSHSFTQALEPLWLVMEVPFHRPVRITDTFSTAQALTIHSLVFFTYNSSWPLSSSAGDYDEGLQRELSNWSFIRVSSTIRHTHHSPHIEGLAAVEFSAERHKGWNAVNLLQMGMGGLSRVHMPIMLLRAQGSMDNSMSDNSSSPLQHYTSARKY